MVRARPDVEEDQRPEVDDREPVGIDRTISALRDEVIHDGEEARGEEEADRVVAVPPLRQRILHAGEDDVADFEPEKRHRDGQVVDDVQHRDGDDERQIEPVRDVDMLFLALPDRAEEDEEVDHPDQREPEIGVPRRLGVFLATA
jgi:23S rRNA (cytosine1962-C5)-methyltransferase